MKTLLIEGGRVIDPSQNMDRITSVLIENGKVAGYDVPRRDQDMVIPADGTGYGTHFRVRIASPLFAGRSRVARHRLVYDALQEFVDRGLHALAIETF